MTAGATFEGEVTNTGGENLDERGFVWDTSSHADPGNTSPTNSTYTSNWTETGTFGTGVYDHDETGLQSDTTYYYRAVGHNSIGWAYGDEVSFTTPQEPQILVASTGISTSAGQTSSLSVGSTELVAQTVTTLSMGVQAAFGTSTDKFQIYYNSDVLIGTDEDQ